MTKLQGKTTLGIYLVLISVCLLDHGLYSNISISTGTHSLDQAYSSHEDGGTRKQIEMLRNCRPSILPFSFSQKKSLGQINTNKIRFTSFSG